MNPEQENNIEKRKYQRKNCYDMPVYCSLTDKVFTCNIRDISENGLYMESDEVFPMGQELALVFSVYDKLNLVKLTGNVIRINNDGFALQFKDVSQKDIDAIKAYVKI